MGWCMSVIPEHGKLQQKDPVSQTLSAADTYIPKTLKHGEKKLSTKSFNSYSTEKNSQIMGSVNGMI